MVKAKSAARNKRSAPKTRKPRLRSASVPLSRAVKVMVRGQPKQKMLPNGNVIVSHKEMLGTVSLATTSAYQLPLQNLINAGNYDFSNFLGGVSQQYETYRFNKLQFTFIPSVPTTFAGTVYLTADYDPTDVPPINSQAMTITPGSVSTPVSKSATFTCAAKDLHNRPRYFVRRIADPVPLGGDRQYDTGKFYVATEGTLNAAGNAITGPIGQVWVSYTVELMTPQYSPPRTIAEFTYNVRMPAGVTDRQNLSNADSNVVVKGAELANNLFTATSRGWTAKRAAKVLVEAASLLTSDTNGQRFFPMMSKNDQTLLNSLPTMGGNYNVSPRDSSGARVVFTNVDGATTQADGGYDASWIVDLLPGDFLTPGVAYGSSKPLGPVSNLYSFIDFVVREYEPNVGPLPLTSFATYRSYLSQQWYGGGTSTAAVPFGTTPASIGGDYSLVDVQDGPNTLFVIPEGEFHLSVHITGTSLSAFNLTWPSEVTVIHADAVITSTALIYHAHIAASESVSVDVSLNALATVSTARLIITY